MSSVSASLPCMQGAPTLRAPGPNGYAHRRFPSFPTRGFWGFACISAVSSRATRGAPGPATLTGLPSRRGSPGGTGTRSTRDEQGPKSQLSSWRCGFTSSRDDPHSGSSHEGSLASKRDGSAGGRSPHGQPSALRMTSRMLYHVPQVSQLGRTAVTSRKTLL